MVHVPPGREFASARPAPHPGARRRGKVGEVCGNDVERVVKQVLTNEQGLPNRTPGMGRAPPPRPPRPRVAYRPRQPSSGRQPRVVGAGLGLASTPPVEVAVLSIAPVSEDTGGSAGSTGAGAGAGDGVVTTTVLGLAEAVAPPAWTAAPVPWSRPVPVPTTGAAVEVTVERAPPATEVSPDCRVVSRVTEGRPAAGMGSTGPSRLEPSPAFTPWPLTVTLVPAAGCAAADATTVDREDPSCAEPASTAPPAGCEPPEEPLPPMPPASLPPATDGRELELATTPPELEVSSRALPAPHAAAVTTTMASRPGDMEVMGVPRWARPHLGPPGQRGDPDTTGTSGGRGSLR